MMDGEGLGWEFGLVRRLYIRFGFEQWSKGSMPIMENDI